MHAITASFPAFPHDPAPVHLQARDADYQEGEQLVSCWPSAQGL